MKNFNGTVLFLDRADINTDEIIPARYLTEISRDVLKPYLFEDFKLDGFNPRQDLPGKNVIISRANFGCGSSREHAPWALEANGINMVVAESFARIFRQNMFNCGMMAVELPAETIASLFSNYAGSETRIDTDFEQCVFRITGGDRTEDISFSLAEFDRQLVAAGGWLEFADAKY